MLLLENIQHFYQFGDNFTTVFETSYFSYIITTCLRKLIFTYNSNCDKKLGSTIRPMSGPDNCWWQLAKEQAYMKLPRPVSNQQLNMLLSPSCLYPTPNAQINFCRGCRKTPLLDRSCLPKIKASSDQPCHP